MEQIQMFDKSYLRGDDSGKYRPSQIVVDRESVFKEPKPRSIGLTEKQPNTASMQ